ncbi:MAG: BA14K family protein [Brevundimonas sp.]
MVRLALIAAAGLALAAAPASAQSRGGAYDGGYRGGDAYRSHDGYGQQPYYGGYGDRSYDDRSYGDGYGSRRSNAVPSNFDWRSQLDRPGDYRCDQFWDASRTNCGDRWRDQRHRVSPQARRDYRDLAGYSGGYGYGHGRYGHAPRRGYGSAYDYGHAQGSTTWHGAYGRPDHVYPGGGVSYGGYSGGYSGGYGHGGSRADWCRATYRSYDPRSGYYRAYSGRLIYCG